MIEYSYIRWFTRSVAGKATYQLKRAIKCGLLITFQGWYRSQTLKKKVVFRYLVHDYGCDRSIAKGCRESFSSLTAIRRQSCDFLSIIIWILFYLFKSSNQKKWVSA